MTIEDQAEGTSQDEGASKDEAQEENNEIDQDEDGASLVDDTQSNDKAEGDEAGAKDEAKEEAKEEDQKSEPPESADKYDLTIPSDIGLKDENGDALQFADDDPLAKNFRDLAFQENLSQEAVNKFVSLYAEAIKSGVDSTSNAQKEITSTRKAEELEKLKSTDANGKEITPAVRVQAVLQSLDKVLGEGASKKIAPVLTSAEHVFVFEKLIAKAQEGAGKGEAQGDDDSIRGEARLKKIYSGKK